MHYNYLESLQIVLVLIFIAGLKQPLAAIILACIYFTGRTIYSFGYAMYGPNGRGIGDMIFGLSVVALFGLSLYTVAEFMKMYQVQGSYNDGEISKHGL